MSSGIQKTGFNGTYYYTCGGMRTENSGVITSPKYDDAYEPGLDCLWHVNLEPGQVATFTFDTDPFNVDGHGPYCNDTGYAGDFVALYNGDTTDAPPLPIAPSTSSREADGTTPYYCGLQDEDLDLPSLESTQSKILVWFHSSLREKTHEHQGFLLKYEIKTLTCGSDELMLEEEEYRGKISSPQFPSPYPPGQYCVWTITAPETEGVQLRVRKTAVSNYYF